MYNRKQRREMESKVGLTREFKNMSKAEQDEIRKRKAAAGKQIHLRNTQEAENRRMQLESDIHAKSLQGLIHLVNSEEEANAILQKNADADRKRSETLALRKEKQMQAALLKKNPN